MTNQASEDELRTEIAQYLESTYQDGAVMATRPNSGYHKRVDEFTDKLLALIRTEKLKLLAELEEYSEVMNSDVVPIYGVPMSVIYTLIAKLEAEL